MKKKQTFLMYKDWDLFINDLTDEQAGKLLKAIYAKQNGRDADVDESIKTLYLYIVKKLDENDEKYQVISERRKAAADAKWRKYEENKRMQKDANSANASKHMQMHNNDASAGDTDTVTDTDIVTDTVTGTGTDTGMDTVTDTDTDTHIINTDNIAHSIQNILVDLATPKPIKIEKG